MNYVTSTPIRPQEDQVGIKKGNLIAQEAYILKEFDYFGG